MSTAEASLFRPGPPATGGMTFHLADYDFDLPIGRLPFDEFRKWTLSDDFPQRGRFDYLGGRIEADMSPESLFSHNQPKTEIVSMLYRRARRRSLGQVFGDRARVVVESVGLSCEPDVTYVANASFDSGRVKLTPKDDRPNDAIEIVGPPDLVVEIVSDSSVRKDTRDLFALYFDAGVPEYWLIDVRGADASFRLLTRGDTGWRESERDDEGFVLSPVLACRYVLERTAGRRGEWQYDLIERELA